MRAVRHGIRLTLVAAFLAVPIAWSEPLPRSQAVDGVYLQLLFEDKESRWWRHHLEIWFTADRLRLDGFTADMNDEQTSSFFFVAEPEPMFIITNHAERTAMTCTVAQAVATQQGTDMRMADWPIVASPEGPLVVLPTGTGKMLGSWNAYELQLRKPGPEKERIRVSEREVTIVTRDLNVASLWFSADVREDRAEITELLAGALRPYLDGGGTGLWFHSLYLHTLVGLRARPVDDLPNLLPVQVTVSDPSGPRAITTLRAVSVGAIDASIFKPPQGYERTLYPGC